MSFSSFANGQQINALVIRAPEGDVFSHSDPTQVEGALLDKTSP